MASWDYPAVAAPRTADYAPPVQDFSKFNLVDDFIKGRQESRAEDQANAFRNGIPKLKDANGKDTANPDYGAIADTTAKYGGINAALPIMQLGAGLTSGNAVADAIRGGAAQPPQAAGGAAASVSPSSAAPAPQSPPTSTPQQPTVRQILAAQGIPNDQLDAASASVSQQLGVGTDDPINTKDPRIAGVLGPAIGFLKKNGVGQVVAQDDQPAPSAAPTPQAPPAPASDATPGMDLATADRLTRDAANIRALVTGYGPAMNKQAAEAAMASAAAKDAQAKQIRDYNSEEDKSTPDQKNYQSDKLPGESMADYQARAAGGAELAKQDSVAYSKKYEGIQKASQEASVEQPKIQLMKQFANDPNFYSGPLEPTNRGFKQFAATIGADPNKALPQEGFNKVASDMLTSQIRALGASGAGPVRIAEVKNMQKSIANLGITPVTNRLLVEITDRTYNDIQHIADLTRKYAVDKNNRPGAMNVGLDQQIHEYYEKHPLFTKEEIADPRLIAPPEFKDSRMAFNAKLPKGQPVKIDGKLKWVQ